MKVFETYYGTDTTTSPNYNMGCRLNRKGSLGLALKKNGFQCRLPRIVRNHIAAAFLVWIHLMRKASEKGQTLYQVKHGDF